MCGFAGEFCFRPPSRADLDGVRRMAARVRHRGPHETGSFASEDGACAIGFQRLAVIDPAGSHQPMTSCDGRFTLAYNGEVYNYQELRAKYRAEGWPFQTRGDTEVVLAGLAMHGPDALEEFNGMFAIALHDARENALLLSRDRFGQKPLFYAQIGDRVVFGSEAKALRNHSELSNEPDLLGIQHYLSTGYIPAPGSAWAGIRKMCPGSYLWCIRSSGISESAPFPEHFSRPRMEMIEPAEVRGRVIRAVERHLAADVPLGILLSGGVDSAVITAAVAQAAGRSGGIRTFTAGFSESTYDERPAARRVSRHCGTDHTELMVRPKAAKALDEMIRLYDEPFADSSAIATSLICRAAAEHVTVALGGDGGDEVFGGYDRYRAMHLAEDMRPWQYAGFRLAAGLARPLAPHEPRSRWRRLIRFADGLPLPPAPQYFRYRAIFDTADLRRLLTDDFRARADVEATEAWFCELYERPGDVGDECTRAQLHDLRSYLPDDLLVKSDRASMAWSLELRAPMLDADLIDLGLGLPIGAKLAGGRGKAILREAFRHDLPREVFARPKRGFGVPLGQWLREDLRPVLMETLTDRSFLDRRIVRREAVYGLINDHLSGKADQRERLWSLLVLARWLDGQDR